MEWSEEAVRVLETLWAKGATAREIAGRLDGVSRNAVIGKANRLGLRSRASPIKRREPQRPVPAERGCKWPFGHPGEAGFGFCGAPPLIGRPYCAAHCAIAYRGKSDEAA